MFGFYGFGLAFGIIFVLAFGLIVFCILKGVMQWNKNNHSPRLTVSAVVVSKRTQVSHHHHNNGTGGTYMTSSTSYYVTFQVKSGDRMELCVGGREYGMLAEDDKGKLTFQGTRFLSFERETENI